MEWKLEKRKIKDLKEFAKNPRSITKHQMKEIKKSLDKFGLCEPIVINTDDLIIGGHQRVRALRSLGKREVDVYVPDITLTEKEVEELNIRLNRNRGDWDFDMLANTWETNDLIDWGFAEFELQIDLPDDEDSEKKVKEDKTCPHCGLVI